MEGDLLIGHFIVGKKRKRDAARQGRSKRSSSRCKDSPQRDQVLIEVDDQDDAAPEMGLAAISSPPQFVLLGGDLAGPSQKALSERPPSPRVVTYEVATEGRSTRFSIPPPSPSLGDVQLETLVTLPAHDRACISAGSDDDLNNMVLLKLSQATLGMIEVVGRRQDRHVAMDEAKKAAEDRQRELLDEVARLARELEEEKGRSATLEGEKTSLSSEVGSISARVTELEGEKVNLIQQLEAEKKDQARRLEEAVESFKSSPEFTAVAMERMANWWWSGSRQDPEPCGCDHSLLLLCSTRYEPEQSHYWKKKRKGEKYTEYVSRRKRRNRTQPLLLQRRFLVVRQKQIAASEFAVLIRL
ncbi:unnamed protein product [Cuscuta campestris]|uniref:Uncharacterized protein n=1 Tax=Cuscuta campestris TaxID=132261 RepID=A0A484MLH4_9ASTE|nr:unnamed protein product [Cuscuta campestris]